MKSEAEVKAALDLVAIMNDLDNNVPFTAIRILKWVLDEK